MDARSSGCALCGLGFLSGQSHWGSRIISDAAFDRSFHNAAKRFLLIGIDARFFNLSLLNFGLSCAISYK
jgi:hypothetical protein